MANIILRNMSKQTMNRSYTTMKSCGRYPICLCIEYLNFSNDTDMMINKQCYLTYENDLRYNKEVNIIKKGLPTCEISQLWYDYDYDIEKILNHYKKK